MTMLVELVDSWPLFRDAYLVGWLAAALLSVVGVVVIARDEVFLGAALSQAATLGVALALWLPAALGLEQSAVMAGNAFKATMAVALSVAAALAVEAGAERTRESRDAVLGWTFLVAASVSLLVVSHSPHGLEEIHSLMSSSIISAGRADVLVFSAALLTAAAFVASSRRPLLLFVLDRPMAEAVGMRVGRWSALLAAATGLVVGLSLRTTGLLYTFGCLVLPALAARSLCREIGTMFAVAPAVALGTATVGFVLGKHYDYPPAQMTVALQSGVLVAAWLTRRVRRGG